MKKICLFVLCCAFALNAFACGIKTKVPLNETVPLNENEVGSAKKLEDNQTISEKETDNETDRAMNGQTRQIIDQADQAIPKPDENVAIADGVADNRVNHVATIISKLTDTSPIDLSEYDTSIRDFEKKVKQNEDTSLQTYHLLKLELDEMEEQIDMLEQQLETRYYENTIKKATYRTADQEIDRLEDHLDRIEKQLELQFNIDD